MVGVNVNGRLVLLLLHQSWLGSHAVSLVLMELQQVLRGEGELTALDQTAMMVLQVDVFLEVIRPLEACLTLLTAAIVIIDSIFSLKNLGSPF